MSNVNHCHQIIKLAATIGLGIFASVGIANAAIYTGANASSEVISIEYNSNQAAEITAQFDRNGVPAVREIWQAQSSGGGFFLMPPANSQILSVQAFNSGKQIEYRPVNKKSTLLECVSGCVSFMPNLLSLKR
jgi:hypothetical protein